MNFNLQCDNFKNNILNVINESKLPIAVIYYILKSLLSDIEVQYYDTISQLNLVQQQNKKEKEEQK